MRVTALLGALGLAFGVLACGDHYEGGGRRDEVPTDSTSSGGPALGTGDGMSTHGGSTSGTGGSAGGGGSSGSFPFPFGGSAGSGGGGGAGGG